MVDSVSQWAGRSPVCPDQVLNELNSCPYPVRCTDLRPGSTNAVDILMDASNPGLWMGHCHIAEHMESGMMFSFRVRSESS